MLKHVLFVIKLTVTISLCTWIVLHVDWEQVWSELRHISLGLILVVVGLRFLGMTISAYKWQRLLRVHELRYGLGQLQKWYLIAMFLNYFLPTSIGGDSYRIYKTLDNPKSRSCAVLAVLAERATGMATLLLMGYAAAIFNYVRDGDELSRILAIIGTVGIAAGLIGLWIMLRWRLLQKLATAKFCPKPVATLIRFAGDFQQHPREIALAGLISLVFHSCFIFALWLLVYALGTTCDFTQLIVAVAAMNIIGLLPISLGGLGLVDGSFIYFMGYYGISLETGLSTMLLWRFLLIPITLLGAYFYFAGDRGAKESAIKQVAEG